MSREIGGDRDEREALARMVPHGIAAARRRVHELTGYLEHNLGALCQRRRRRLRAALLPGAVELVLEQLLRQVEHVRVQERLEQDHEALLQLLSVKNQRFLQLEDLRFLLNALGAIHLEEFNILSTEISDLKVTPKPFASKTTGFKYVYELSYEELDPYLMPALDYFANILLELVSIWSAEDIIELSVDIKNLHRKILFTPRGSPS